MLSGAAGHSYATDNVWKALVPESPVLNKSGYPKDTSYLTNALDLPGARSVGFVAKFLRDMEWWKLESHPEFVFDNRKENGNILAS